MWLSIKTKKYNHIFSIIALVKIQSALSLPRGAEAEARVHSRFGSTRNPLPWPWPRKALLPEV